MLTGPSRALALSVCQTILVNSLLTSVPPIVPSIPTDAIIHGGAGSLIREFHDPGIVAALREAYSDAIHGTFVFAVTAACVSLLAACGMEWRNIKHEANAQKEQEKSQ
jgi:hypothetical protein